MSINVPIYAQEKTDGLAEAIQANHSLSYICPIILTEGESWLSEAQLSLIKEEGIKLAQAVEDANFDLFHTKSILASSVWNKNDDYLERKQIWLARHTAVNKRFNVEHNESDIIGHMVGTFIIDDKSNLIADNTSVDELPDKIHIVDASVIYNYWRDENSPKKNHKFH